MPDYSSETMDEQNESSNYSIEPWPLNYLSDPSATNVPRTVPSYLAYRPQGDTSDYNINEAYCVDREVPGIR